METAMVARVIEQRQSLDAASGRINGALGQWWWIELAGSMAELPDSRLERRQCHCRRRGGVRPWRGGEVPGEGERGYGEERIEQKGEVKGRAS